MWNHPAGHCPAGWFSLVVIRSSNRHAFLRKARIYGTFWVMQSFPLRFEYLLTHKNECRRYLIRRLFLQLPVWFCEKNFFVYPSCTSKSGISLVSIFVGNRGTALFLYGLYEYYTTKGAKINSLLPKRCSSIWFCTAFSVSRRKKWQKSFQSSQTA